MNDYEVKVIMTENFPPGLGGASVFDGDVHYIFINVNISPEQQQKIINEEKQRNL